jgi:hypothetical protein
VNPYEVSQVMGNPFDVVEVARDLVRHDECHRLFTVLHDLFKEIEAGDSWEDEPEVRKGVLKGLDIAMNELDERIGELRNRWG